MKKDELRKKKKLPSGKLSSELLEGIFKKYSSPSMMENLNKTKFKHLYENSKKRVKVGFALGEDAAVIESSDSNTYLVAKTDPITFTTEDIGHYVVNVNANDIVTMGATPKWFQATILLPAEIATDIMAEKICCDIQKACLDIGVVLTGGHTEVTYDLKRPIVIGSMIGEVDKNHLVQSSNGKAGDAIILTKGVPLEGTSIIAREKEAQLLDLGITKQEIQKSRDLLFSPGISVIQEALLAVQNFRVHAMHDPTEGGLAMGLVELARASKCGFNIDSDDIPIIPLGKRLCELFHLNPLQTISSGSLLIVVDDEDSDGLLHLLKQNEVLANKIGVLTKEQNYLITTGSVQKEIQYSEKDEITKIFKN